MKKQNLQRLALNKKAIAGFSIKGGMIPEDASGGSEHNPNSMDILKCTPETMIANTDCTCA